MPCYAPVQGYRARGGGLTSRKHSPTQAPVTFPCGGCIGCRLDRAQEWGTRIAHEATLHDESSFLTLTYNDQCLPDDCSVSIREIQLFNKRLRERIAPQKIRYFACGEYGEQTRRPHYHSIIFGYAFPDKVPWRKATSGHILYRSPLLETLWPYGHAEIGSVTRESGAYVARYCLKKVNGPASGAHYQSLHPHTGELVDLRPEFAVMSTRPGLGYGWLKKYETDAFPSAFVVINGKKTPIPRFYKKKLDGRYLAGDSDADALVDADDLRPTRIKLRSRANSSQVRENSTPERLAVREELQRLKQANISRDKEP